MLKLFETFTTFRCPAGVMALFLGLIGCIVAASPVRAAIEHETIAGNYLKYLRSDKVIIFSEALDRSLLDSALSPVTAAYLFHLQGGGYILVSSDRSISPVKAYSLQSDFAALPETYRRALLAELELRTRAAAWPAPGRTAPAAGAGQAAARWDFLLNLKARRIPLAYVPATHLIQTTWNQDYPYNKFLPATGGNTVVAGCVNIALAQIMNYYEYPAASSGVSAYQWNGPPVQTLKTILHRSYNWDNMPDSLDGQTPEYQIDEVALLIKDLGIANRTDFDFDGSSTAFYSNILTENFGYSTALSGMDNSNHAAFTATLQAEFNAERPVLITFPGHMAVADGYKEEAGVGIKIHVNMGWGGTADDFYFLDQPVPRPPEPDFSTAAGDLNIYYNIKPAGDIDRAINLEANDLISGLAITGNFDDAGDKDRYAVYLKGPAAFRATRGYSNMAFFVSIHDALDESLVFPSPDPEAIPANSRVDAGSLPAGKYVIRASLCDDTVEGTTCFNPAAGFDSYSVTLETAAVTAGEMTVIDQAMDRPPVFGSAFGDRVLNATSPAATKILIDARDENGDSVTLQAESTNPAAVTAVLSGNILELTPTSTPGISSLITVRATAGGKTTAQSFKVMTDDSDTAFGKSFTVSGTFAGQDDVQTRRVILDGDCTITGNNFGYDGQYFFSSVRTEEGDMEVDPGDPDGGGVPAISHNFLKGVYLLDASLEQNPGGAGTYYPYESGDGDQYALHVSCLQADSSTTTIAGLLGIDLDGTLARGDINGDGTVDMADAILTLQLLSGMDTAGKTIDIYADADGDGKIGPADVIFVIQKMAAKR